MNDPRIPVADIRAAQNKCLELLGLDPVSETEYENMHHHSGDDFMTEYRYNRRGTADRVVGTVTEWVSVGESVEATKREVRIGGAHPRTYIVMEMPKGTYDGPDYRITQGGKYIAHAATLPRALYLIQRHFVYSTVEHHEIMSRPMFMEHMGDGLDIVVTEGPDFDIRKYPDSGSFMFTYTNDDDPCCGEYSYLVNDNEAMFTANWAFIDDTRKTRPSGGSSPSTTTPASRPSPTASTTRACPSTRTAPERPVSFRPPLRRCGGGRPASTYR
ncbi:hypothetical protein [Streptomyces albipurpureus]|uniref:Uncharacterized protein n=1 Tax=Streptomyces albipurpureus TaxID=2897419 RepID=A0ABT0UW07_9ACTN|nr:hypothetical protein [Streptomyces sp. CWNU-1]MCM2392611.1 hypothetical protein [Streptomyces sp. CWNU-1]